MDIRLFHLIATVIDACDQQPSPGPGHPPTETIRVVAALRRFLREGTPWRSLTATPDQASGSTLRRCLRRWAERGLLAKVHALLAAMLRGHPDLILDTCSVRAKRGGDLTGPNPTDRGKRGSKIPHRNRWGRRTGRLPRDGGQCQRHTCLRAAVPGCLCGYGPYPDCVRGQGYDAERHRELCRAFAAKPSIHKRGQPRGSGLGKHRWPVERSNAWVLENRRLALRYDRRGFVIQSLLQTACIFLVAGRLASQF